MILLDTHIWIWWVHGDTQLPLPVSEFIQSEEEGGLGVSAISCWEVAKLVERKRLMLPLATHEWMAKALSYPGIRLIPLVPNIAVESTQLPGSFHKDPADQIIVATARSMGCGLVTMDLSVRSYPHVTILPKELAKLRLKPPSLLRGADSLALVV